MNLKTEIQINAPVEKVFDVFTDIENLDKNVESITKVEILKGEGKMKTGSKWKETRKILDEETTNEMTITFLDKDKIFEVAYKHQNTDYRILYTFFSIAGTTDVDVVFESQHKGFFALFLRPMNKLFKAAFTSALEKDLNDLKKAAESQSTQ